MENVDKFDITEFRTRIKLSDNSFWYHKNAGHVPDKVVFTQEDVDNFIQKYTRPKKKQEKKLAISKEKIFGTNPDSPQKYNIRQLAEAIGHGTTYNAAYLRIQRGQFPKKSFYTDKDVAKYKKQFIKEEKEPKASIKGKASDKEKYSPEEFAAKIGTTYKNLTANIFYRHPNLRKKKYSDLDIQNYFQRFNRRKQVNSSLPKSSKKVSGNSQDKYSMQEFAEKIGTSYKMLYYYKKIGKIPNKKQFSDEDVRNFKNGTNVTENVDRLDKIAETSIASFEESSENPFEIKETVMIRTGSTPYLDYLVKSLIKLPIYSNSNHQGLYVSAKVYGTGTKAGTALQAAKTIIRKEYPNLKNAGFRVTNHKNAEKIYTHSYFFRTA